MGKTTYLKDIVRKLLKRGVPARDILYLSLDFFTSRRELRNAINYFLDSRRGASLVYLFLDEVTALEDWNLELKYLADQGALKKGSILATGSSAVKLKYKGELMPGRGLEGNEYYLKPISFREFSIQSLQFISQHLPDDEFASNLKRLELCLSDCSVSLTSDLDNIMNSVEAVIPFKKELEYLFRLYIITGGSPGVVNHYLSNRFLSNKDKIAPNIAEIYIRDVLGDINRLQKQESITRQLLKAIIEHYGSRYSFSKLSRHIERTHVTTIDYLEFLEDSFICFVLYAYDFNKKDIKAKGDKKVYFFDPFVLHSVMSYLKGMEIWEIVRGSIENEDWLGKLMEGIVLSHLRMYGEIPFLKVGNTFLWFYYDKSGKEIDAINKVDRGYLGLEIKYQGNVDERDVKRINSVENYIILTKEDVGVSGNTMMIPVDVFLALLPKSERNI